MTQPEAAPQPASPEPPLEQTSKPSCGLSAVVLVVMCVAVLFTYRSPDLTTGVWRLGGIDYSMLHRWRIEFAQDFIREHHAIPSWYPREFMGSPFWSNLQNFPFSPARLALLWLNSNDIFTVEVYLLALLSAFFAYLYARTIGISPIGSGLTGFTFACSGFFASRLRAGQIGILEVYASLPVLLWIVHRLCVSHKPNVIAVPLKPFVPAARWYLALAVACACFVVSAHPQIFIYSLATAGAYLLWRCRSLPTLVRASLAMILGLGAASFVLYPMMLLVGRSSRILHLEHAFNDLPMQYNRLWSMLFPWQQGAPSALHAPPGVQPWPATETYAKFWDAVNYVGWLPLLAAALFAIRAAFWQPKWRGQRMTSDGMFITVAAIVALLLALPVLQTLSGTNSGAPGEGGIILLRSPARLMYVVTFALALAVGAAVDVIGRAARSYLSGVRFGVSGISWATLIMLAVASVQFIDVYRHDRCFMISWSGPVELPADMRAQIIRIVGDGRVGIDKTLDLDLNRRIDDVGVFDSILLAGSYETMLDLNGAPAKLNIQELDGVQMSPQALVACGVKLLFSSSGRRDMQPTWSGGGANIFQLNFSAPRVMYFPATVAKYITHDETRELIRSRRIDPSSQLILPPQAATAVQLLETQMRSATASATPARTTAPTTEFASQPSRIPYDRPRSDQFKIDIDEPEAGFVRILENFDPGWQAQVDGQSVPIFTAHNMAIAIPVLSGRHHILIEFSTPGRNVGMVLSVVSIVLLAALILNSSRARQRAHGFRLIKFPADSIPS